MQMTAHLHPRLQQISHDDLYIINRADLKLELLKIEDNDAEIRERFAAALKFGTGGLRGILGAGTNRMNLYVVRQATSLL